MQFTAPLLFFLLRGLCFGVDHYVPAVAVQDCCGTAELGNQFADPVQSFDALFSQALCACHATMIAIRHIYGLMAGVA